jgi:hypothetical protein
MGFAILASIIGTSLWVYFDARWIGVYRTGEPHKVFQLSLDMEPVDWLISCLLLWVVAFPAYLLKRPGFIKQFPKSRARSTPPPVEPVEYFYEQLRNLSKLRQEGHITEKEFSLKRKEVLGL